MTEAELQQLVMETAKACGVLAYHTHDSRRSNPGWPDVVLVGSAGAIFRELKSATGRLSPMQVIWLRALQAAGLDVDVWRPVHWPDVIVQEIRSLGRLAVQEPVMTPSQVRRKLSARRK